PCITTECPLEYEALLERCWDIDPKDRLTATDLLSYIDEHFIQIKSTQTSFDDAMSSFVRMLKIPRNIRRADDISTVFDLLMIGDIGEYRYIDVYQRLLE